MAKGFTWNSTDLQVNLTNAKAKIHTAVSKAVDYQATRSETYMRTNARWSDRTTNARNGLSATPYKSPEQYTIVLAHAVHYGIWLEVRWSGKYGILPQSIRQGGEELMNMLTKLLKALS